MEKIIINEDFKNWLTPLTFQEIDNLKQSILTEGCRDALILWNGILIDGHNRYKICIENDIPYTTISKDFADKNEVLKWIDSNQLSRRNLTDEQRSFLRGRLSKINKLPEGNNQLRQNVAVKNQQTVAEDLGINRKTLQRDEQYTDAVEKIATTFGIDFKNKILAGQSNLTKQDTIAVSKMEPEKQQSIIDKIETGVAKNLKEAQRKIIKEDNKNNFENYIPNNEIIILEGDLFDKLNDIADYSVDVLNTDPPYYVLGEDWDSFKSKEDFLLFTEKWLTLATKKVKKTGRIYISFAPDYKYDLYNILYKNDFFGFNFGQEIIWVKKNNNKPFDRNRYRLTYEPIIYLYGKDSTKLNFTDDTYGQNQTDVWEIATPQSNYNEGKEHPAQKPLELYKFIIKTSSNVGDIILDCFAGSGTTGLVCKELNRKCILIEKNIDYIKIIKGRL